MSSGSFVFYYKIMYKNTITLENVWTCKIKMYGWIKLMPRITLMSIKVGFYLRRFFPHQYFIVICLNLESFRVKVIVLEGLKCNDFLTIVRQNPKIMANLLESLNLLTSLFIFIIMVLKICIGITFGVVIFLIWHFLKHWKRKIFKFSIFHFLCMLTLHHH